MKLPTLLILLTLTGCTTTQPVVVGCPKPNIPPAPHYPVAELKPGDAPDKVAKAYTGSLYLCKVDNDNLRHVLNGYT